jgi:hypothetical protein
MFATPSPLGAKPMAISKTGAFAERQGRGHDPATKHGLQPALCFPCSTARFSPARLRGRWRLTTARAIRYSRFCVVQEYRKEDEMADEIACRVRVVNAPDGTKIPVPAGGIGLGDGNMTIRERRVRRR